MNTEETSGKKQTPSRLDQAARRYRDLRKTPPASTPYSQPQKTGKIYTQLMVPPGRVRLDLLDDPAWATQLHAFFRAYGRIRSNDFQAKASEITYKNRLDVVRSTFIDLRASRNIKTLSQIRPRLLPAMFELWAKRGVQARARINYYNTMRWFWRVCGLEIPPIKHYEKVPGEYTINRTAETDKSWSGNGLDVQEILRKIEEIDPVAGRLALAMQTFGLRLKESICLQPNEAHKCDSLHLTKGTKSGRPRQLEFLSFRDDEHYRNVIASLKGQVPPEAHLAWQNRTLKQAKDRMYYIARQVGLTHNQLGVTWHGLRHEWAIKQLEDLTGQAAPVRGGIAIDYKSLSAARRKVSEGLGHHRVKITGAYYGSFLSLERDQAKRFDRSWHRIEAAVENAADVLQEHGIDNLYWIGLRSLGAACPENEGFEFALPPGLEPGMAVTVAGQLAQAMTQQVGLPCTVHVWEAMSEDRRILNEVESVPLLASVAPVDVMLHRLREQRPARSRGVSGLEVEDQAGDGQRSWFKRQAT